MNQTQEHQRRQREHNISPDDTFTASELVELSRELIKQFNTNSAEARLARLVHQIAKRMEEQTHTKQIRNPQ